MLGLLLFLISKKKDKIVYPLQTRKGKGKERNITSFYYWGCKVWSCQFAFFSDNEIICEARHHVLVIQSGIAENSSAGLLTVEAVLRPISICETTSFYCFPLLKVKI